MPRIRLHLKKKKKDKKSVDLFETGHILSG
jgi:hypothetical protein